MKIIQKGFLILLILCLAAVLVLSFLGRGQKISVYENRALARKPAFSVSALLDGSYFSGWDDYFSDHIAYRDDLIRAYLGLQLYGKRSVIANGVVITEDVLLPKLPYYDNGNYDYPARSDASLERQLAIQRLVEDYGGTYLFVGVDEQRVALIDRFPSYVFSNRSHYMQLSQTFAQRAKQQGLHAIFTREIFPEKDDPLTYYSAVDHHYNLEGAYAAYLAICAELNANGFRVPVISREELEITPFSGEFYGSYNRKLYDLSPVTEQLQVFSTRAMPAYQRWDNGERTDAPLLVLPDDGTKVSYTAYMGGDIGETVIRTNRPELPNVLIVGDSFANPVECLSVYSFNELRSLDFRSYTEKTLSEYLREYPADVVLVIRDCLNYNLLEGNGDLR